MNKKNRKPAIRFKAFNDPWEQCKLQNVLNVNSGRDYKGIGLGNIPVYGTGGYMLSIAQALSYDRDAIGIGRKGTINKPYVLKAPFWTVDTLFYAVPCNPNSLNFLYAFFQTVDWTKKDESTGVPSLSKDAINETLLKIPVKEEQEEIGNFFQKLTGLITLHQRKLDKLQNVKKACLEKMFPQNGESVPRIRFKGFTDTWEQRKLGQLAEIVGGGTPDTTVKEYWNGDINWYAPAEIGDKIFLESSQRKITPLGLQKSSARILPPGTVLFTSRAGIGNTAILQTEATTNQGFQSIVPHQNELNTYFIYSCTTYLKRYAETVAGGSTFLEISKKMMEKMTLFVPVIEEQKKVGVFYKKLDDLITLHQRKLDKLKNLKKACLVKMFV